MADAKKRVKAVVDEQLLSCSPDAFVSFMLKRIADTSETPSTSARLDSLILIISLLINCRDASALPRRDVIKLEKIAGTILQLHRVTTNVSLLHELFSDLYSAFGRYFRDIGEHYHAIWYQGLANRIALGREGKSADYHALLSTNRLTRLGLVSKALVTAEQAIAKYPESKFLGHLHLACARALRMQGRFAEATQHYSHAKAAGSREKSIGMDAAFEVECMKIQCGAPSTSLLELYTAEPGRFSAEHALTGCLWSLASNLTRDLDGWSKIVKRLKRELTAGPAPISYEASTTLLEFYRVPLERSPIEPRIHLLGTLLTRSSGASSIERELLILLAIGRWLHRKRDDELKSIVINRYRFLCFGMSDGKTADILGIADFALGSTPIAAPSRSQNCPGP